MLTVAWTMDDTLPAALIGGNGFGSLFSTDARAMRRKSCGFFYAQSPVMAGVVGSLTARRLQCPVYQPATSAARRLVAPVGGNKTIVLESVMNNHAQGAPAPTSPSVFTLRESNTIRKALSIIEAKRLRDAPVLYYFEDFERYLVLRFAGLVHEEFHVLYLDSGRRLLAAEVAATGDQKSVSPNYRHIAFRAIGLGADYVVVAHNHPSDSQTPSDADVDALQWSERALGWLNIGLLDSFVVTSQGITSIKKYRQLKEEMVRREREGEWERRSEERRAKLAATRAAKLAAQL